jgi:hypothetical protein
MAERFALLPLKLCLPDPRFSVDFAEFLTEQGALAPREITFRHEATEHDQLSPLILTGARSHLPTKMKFYDIIERPTTMLACSAQPSCEAPLQDSGYSRKGTRRPAIDHSRPSSDVSAQSTATAYSYMPSPCTDAPLTSKTHTSTVSPVRAKHAKSLSTLSQPILKLILAEVLNLPRTVLLGPQQLHVPKNNQKQQRSNDSVTSLQTVLKHPVFLVSRQLRQVALDEFHEKSYFIIDLSGAKNAMRHEKEQRDKHYIFWTTNTPFPVKYALWRVSNLQICLPVPSSDASVPKVGKSVSDKNAANELPKTAQEQVHRRSKLLETLRAIKLLVTGLPQSQPAPPPLPKTPSRTVTLRRKLSIRRIKPRKDSLDFTCCGDTTKPIPSRRGLKNLQIILVKHSATSIILPELLGMVAVLTEVSVHGTLEYYFELDGRRRLWATRSKGMWFGKQPDGKQFMQDLQALRVTAAPMVRLGRRKMRVDCAQVSRIQQQSSSRDRERENALRKCDFPFVAEKKARRRAENLDGPPSVEEIQQLAEMARRGLY